MAFQGRVGDLANALRAAVQTLLRVPLPKSELGCDHNLLAKGCNCLTYQVLVGKWTVRLGGIEERHAGSKAVRITLIAPCLSVGGPYPKLKPMQPKPMA